MHWDVGSAAAQFYRCAALIGLLMQQLCVVMVITMVWRRVIK